MDIVIPSVLVSGLLSGVLLFILKEWHDERKRIRNLLETTLSGHIKECGDKNKTIAVLEEKVCNIEDKVDSLSTKIDRRAEKVDAIHDEIKELIRLTSKGDD